ncbi:MAG: hypothetical protein HN742_01650 [Lentisphaerae bacterium]|nr:hypothetical protein [Lentisphaerota bacterium]MBT4821754.1 hypothetical protein [Lentisphaerota bacterium]MBT5611084.1 hypothetical protein [Lentisphaerota bacterium]MBT7061839.1 hypothetical protein [Lentisphaerota bacterium]MBT7840540.1 hypothetical protein [Lentisphaerota bacterium]
MTKTTAPTEIVADLREGCREVVLSNLSFLVDRWVAKRRPPVVDTKINLITGAEFAMDTARGTVLGPDIVYGWIQGRALEALAGHLMWLRTASCRELPGAPALREATERFLRSLALSLEAFRAKNDGSLHFMVSVEDGSPLRVSEDGAIIPLGNGRGTLGFTEIFYTKGLFAAGVALGDPVLSEEGKAGFRTTLGTILGGGFASDQQPMDPANPVRHVPGRITHGPLMISIGGAALLLEHTREHEWWNRGLDLVDRIVRRHVSRGRFTEFGEHDFIEFVRTDGTPYGSEGSVLCDPGHALEFVGLTCRLLWIGRGTPGLAQPVADAEKRLLPMLAGVFERAFSLGFDPEGEGIRKLVDLQTGQPVHSDMPWWSLPETMRAAALLTRLRRDEAGTYSRALALCWAALQRYLNPELGLMPIQTRDASGTPVNRIPACPDADPCYHTGLSLIDVLRED